MIRFLHVVFTGLFLAMLSITILASIDQNIFHAVGDMWPNWWFKAALADAYIGFLIFFVWVAYKELHMVRKLIWFAALMLLGNMATCAYILLELFKLQKGDSFETLLTRRNG